MVSLSLSYKKNQISISDHGDWYSNKSSYSDGFHFYKANFCGVANRKALKKINQLSMQTYHFKLERTIVSSSNAKSNENVFRLLQHMQSYHTRLLRIPS